MTQKDESISLGRDIDEWESMITGSLKERFGSLDGNGEIWFIHGDGAFHLVKFSDPLYGFVMEFSKGTSEKDRSEALDLGQWPLLDYESPDDMLKDMLSVLGVR